MEIKKNVLQTFALCILLSVTSQNTWSQIQFGLSIGGAAEDRAHAIIQTDDGGYAIAGYTYNFGAVDHDMYIIKLNANGMLQWSRTIGGLWREQAYDIIQTSDGGYAIAGYTHTFGQGSDEDMYLVKLDSTGTFQWHRAIGTFDFGERNRDFAYSVIQASDGGYVLAGYAWRPSSGSGYLNNHIIKLDENGLYQWSRVFGGITPHIDIARCIIQTSDGGYAIAGYSRTTNTDNFYIAKLDENGNLQWNTAVGGPLDDRAYSIIQTSDGGYAVAGQSLSFSFGGAYEKMYIVKLDSAGSLQWTRVIGGMRRDIAYDIIQTDDGGYIAAGYTVSFGYNQIWPHMYFVKLNESSLLEWSKTVGGTSSDFANSIARTADGGFVAAGSSFSYGTTPSIPDIYIVKFDSDGNTCHNTASPQSQTATGGNSSSPNPIMVFPSILVHEPSPILSSGGIETNICLFIPVELTSFTSSVSGNNVILSWVTASEINNSGFEVQRKVNRLQSTVSNSEFETIGFVEGNGTTTVTIYYSFEDKNLAAGKYFYRLKQIDFDGTFEYSNVIEVEVNIPAEFSLLQNYPNPFNPSTTIEYQIPSDGFVSLTIYNTIGQEVSTLLNENQSAGKYSITFEADKLPSGLYFYKLNSGEFSSTKKMLLLK
jgi:hypothetical protein